MAVGAFQANAVFSYFTQLIDEGLTSTTDAIWNRAIVQAGELVLAFGTIAIAFYGLAISAGWVQGPAQGFAKLCAKLAFFSVLVSAGVYAYWVRDAVLVGLPSLWAQLASAGGSVATNAAAFDVVWNGAIQSGLTVWKELSTYNPLKIIILFYWAASLFGVVCGYGIWLLGHIMAVLYVAIGPIFLPLGLFSVTRAMFSAWVGATISTTVLQGLSVMLTTILIGAENAIIRAVVTGGGADTYARVGLMFAAMALFALCGWWALKLPAAAATLCGGIHFAPNLLVSATYGTVGRGANAALNGARSMGSSAAQATRRAISPPPLTPPGPTLSRSPVTTGTP